MPCCFEIFPILSYIALQTHFGGSRDLTEHYLVIRTDDCHTKYTEMWYPEEVSTRLLLLISGVQITNVQLSVNVAKRVYIGKTLPLCSNTEDMHVQDAKTI